MLSFSQQSLDMLFRDLRAFAPELILCGGIVALLLLKLFRSFERVHLGVLAFAIAGCALVVSIVQWKNTGLSARQSVECFSGLLVCDNLTIYLRMFLLGFAACVIVLTMLTRIPDAEDSSDFHVLLLGGTLGMLLMSSANHLLMVYIAVEMASVPSYALAGFLKGRRDSSEAALKYVVYGGGASGIMLYGISLVAGKFGTGYLPDLATGVGAALSSSSVDVPMAMGLVFIFIGLAFKLSAVPFHFWCPDVFEGAAAEIGAFLSIASKGAAMALTGRLVLTLAAPGGEHAVAAFGPVLALFAAITATFGNLAAYAQTNLKRLLAYSTIAHAGYMLMGLSVINERGVAAVLFYLVTYLFTNLGAFAVVAFLRNKTGSEDIRSFRGLIYSSPAAVIALGACLLSLLGMPPLAGFAAKFVIFAELYNTGAAQAAGPNPWLGTMYWALLVIGGFNTVFSLFYYVKVLRVMILDRPDETTVPAPLPMTSAIYVSALAAMVLVLGVAWDRLAKTSDRGAAFAGRAAVTAPGE
jgi:NADH-quinone oxidoreductase subunit N